MTLLNTGIFAVLDTAVPELWLPHNVCDQIASVLNLTYHEDSGRYTITAAAHNALQSLNGSLRFRIGVNLYTNPAITIEIPYKAFDLEASWPIFNTTTRYFPLRKTTNKTQYALGRVFLQEAYLVVDWERDVFMLSQAVFTDPMPEQNIVTIEPEPSGTSDVIGQQSSSKLSAGAIAGIAIGIFLLILGSALGWWFWWRKRKQANMQIRPGSIGVSHGDSRKDPSEHVLSAKTELDGERRQVPEMYAPSRPLELAHGADESARVESLVLPAVYEMADTGIIRR